jgi:hypothetical protein
MIIVQQRGIRDLKFEPCGLQPCIIADAFQLRLKSRSRNLEPPKCDLKAVGRNMTAKVESAAATHHASGHETVTETVAAARSVFLIISEVYARILGTKP